MMFLFSKLEFVHRFQVLCLFNSYLRYKTLKKGILKCTLIYYSTWKVFVMRSRKIITQAILWTLFRFSLYFWYLPIFFSCIYLCFVNIFFQSISSRVSAESILVDHNFSSSWVGSFNRKRSSTREKNNIVITRIYLLYFYYVGIFLQQIQTRPKIISSNMKKQ